MLAPKGPPSVDMEATAGSPVEPSGKFGSPWNKGYAKSAVDGLVEEAASPIWSAPGADTPSGRNLSELAKFKSMGAFGA